MNYAPCDHEAERTISGSIILCFEGGNGSHNFFSSFFFCHQVYKNKESPLQG